MDHSDDDDILFSPRNTGLYTAMKQKEASNSQQASCKLLSDSESESDFEIVSATSRKCVLNGNCQGSTSERILPPDKSCQNEEIPLFPRLPTFKKTRQRDESKGTSNSYAKKCRKESAASEKPSWDEFNSDREDDIQGATAEGGFNPSLERNNARKKERRNKKSSTTTRYESQESQSSSQKSSSDDAEFSDFLSDLLGSNNSTQRSPLTRRTKPISTASGSASNHSEDIKDDDDVVLLNYVLHGKEKTKEATTIRSKKPKSSGKGRQKSITTFLKEESGGGRKRKSPLPSATVTSVSGPSTDRQSAALESVPETNTACSSNGSSGGSDELFVVRNSVTGHADNRNGIAATRRSHSQRCRIPGLQRSASKFTSKSLSGLCSVVFWRHTPI